MCSAARVLESIWTWVTSPGPPITGDPGQVTDLADLRPHPKAMSTVTICAGWPWGARPTRCSVQAELKASEMVLPPHSCKHY